jgi:hypothetical protein
MVGVHNSSTACVQTRTYTHTLSLIHTHTHKCIFVRMHMYIYIHIYYVYVCVWVRVRVLVCVCVSYLRMVRCVYHVCVCKYTFIICTYICIYIHTHAHVHTHLHTHTHAHTHTADAAGKLLSKERKHAAAHGSAAGRLRVTESSKKSNIEYSPTSGRSMRAWKCSR